MEQLMIFIGKMITICLSFSETLIFFLAHVYMVYYLKKNVNDLLRSSYFLSTKFSFLYLGIILFVTASLVMARSEYVFSWLLYTWFLDKYLYYRCIQN